MKKKLLKISQYVLVANNDPHIDVWFDIKVNFCYYKLYTYFII